jgi:dephospho-CoA kinase
MLRLSITGGIACGKSAVGDFMSEAGLAVCDADDLVHSLTLRGKDVFGDIVRLFGTGVIGDNGEIDRRLLGTRVFSNPGELAALNAIVHPEVKKAWLGWLAEESSRGVKAAAVIVPLLYEVGEGLGWDAVVCVSASEKIQVQRLLKRGLCADEVELRMAAQMPLQEKVRRSDFVIVNDGPRELLGQQVRMVIEHIMEKEKWV